MLFRLRDNLQKRKLGSSSAATAHRPGPIILQGPHQSAQKSTTTGTSLRLICLSNAPGGGGRRVTFEEQFAAMTADGLLRIPIRWNAIDALAVDTNDVLGGCSHILQTPHICALALRVRYAKNQRHRLHVDLPDPATAQRLDEFAVLAASRR